MTIVDQRGAYGRKRKCATRLREAKRMPPPLPGPAPRPLPETARPRGGGAGRVGGPGGVLAHQGSSRSCPDCAFERLPTTAAAATALPAKASATIQARSKTWQVTWSTE
ncbi:hypothetical protein GA0115261_104715 [Streptomyces sp. OspMP-M43]|nr:hypothetical protein GA0115261_104715 [Streptomyces sp. OspMP-M43]